MIIKVMGIHMQIVKVFMTWHILIFTHQNHFYVEYACKCRILNAIISFLRLYYLTYLVIVQTNN